MRIYPEIKLPIMAAPAVIKSSVTSPCQPSFDYITGEFRIDKTGRIKEVNGQEAFEDWCLKVCMTERETRACYSDKIGVEFDEIGELNDQNAVKSALIRTITEAIMVHPRAQYVKDFRFKIEEDNLWVSFRVGSEYGESEMAVGY